MPADSIDHVPPQSARLGIINAGLVMHYPFLTIDACRECNSTLGARGLWTLKERKRYVKAALRRKYAKYLRIPDWSDRELGSIAPEMRNYILESLKIREVVRNRLNW